MNKKQYLRSQLKSVGAGYLFYFFFGCHFGYLGKWGTQLLFWFTLYGLGIWGLIELFMVGSRVNEHNAKIYSKIDEIEKKEKDEDFKNQLAIMKTAKE